MQNAKNKNHGYVLQIALAQSAVHSFDDPLLFAHIFESGSTRLRHFRHYPSSSFQFNRFRFSAEPAQFSATTAAEGTAVPEARAVQEVPPTHSGQRTAPMAVMYEDDYPPAAAPDVKAPATNPGERFWSVMT